MKKEKAVIFDLDGTLIDSLNDIAICANQVLKQFDLPVHEIEEYKNFVGGGAEILIRNCTPSNTSEEKISKILKSFKEIYEINLHSNTKPYDGIFELMKNLHTQNIQIGVLSNKPHEFTVKYVEKFFSEYNIKESHGQKKDVPKKPNPSAAIDIAKNFNIKCQDIFFIGDSDVDIKTAKNAGMIAVGVSWGFRGTKELIENGADYIVKTPQDILKLLE